MLNLSFCECAIVEVYITFEKFDVCLIVVTEVSINNDSLTDVRHKDCRSLLCTDGLIVYEGHIVRYEQ